MDCLIVEGGSRLSGSVSASGAKNAALPIMAATLLARGEVRLSRIPQLTDVAVLARVLRGLGATVDVGGLGDIALRVPNRGPTAADPRLTRRMRASFCVLGPLLARRGRAMAALPGGCRIGPRPIDLHLNGLAALGADIRITDGIVVASAKRLRGNCLSMCGPLGPTVTGTANLLCAAATARGKTTLRGAAREPEIVDLGRFLIALGARIEGLGTDVIEIRGVDELGGGRHEVIADRIEAGTLLLAGAITGGRVRVTRVCPSHLRSVVRSLLEMGFAVDEGADWVELSTSCRPRAIDFVARPYPGLPTDLQAQFAAVLAVADGTSAIHDRVFPGRFQHARQLVRMGAQIQRRQGAIRIAGIDALCGAHLTAGDLRASAALVLAALAAEGQSTIGGLRHLDRGYEMLAAKLSHLGAAIRRVSVSSTASRRPIVVGS